VLLRNKDVFRGWRKLASTRGRADRAIDDSTEHFIGETRIVPANITPRCNAVGRSL
jgi:hypothetical protein